ncbi:MAG: hypothetical protein AAFX09_08180 [Pseudomonadota bacterium]
MDGQIEQLDELSGLPNLSKYEPYLDGLSISSEQKQELLAVLWKIMTAFADAGFGLEPTQLICGWIEQSQADGADAPDDVVQSSDKPTSKRFNAAGKFKPGRQENCE